ncbi:type III secretion protein [Pseudomonas salmasensis]|uniref:Type III secretion protein n=1 Tax=Pseudomonas salmasensis TaxID=2745514 RepID=A0ABU5F8U2_9PSED|nr:type III secretion protein [Pseudomonas salmasensis]MDY4298561.1 type III secretion protein [Pseudomonas salmasensis]
MNVGAPSSSSSSSITQDASALANVGGVAGGGEGSAEAIFEKMKADAIKNGWKSAEVKNIQALIRSGAGQ